MTNALSFIPFVVESATMQLVICPFQSIKSIMSSFGEGTSQDFPAASEIQQALRYIFNI